MENTKNVYETPILVQHKPLQKITKGAYPKYPFGMCESWGFYPGGWSGACGEGASCNL